MNTCTIIRITQPGSMWRDEDDTIRGFAIAMYLYAQNNGGVAQASIKDGVLILAIQGLKAEVVVQIVSSWSDFTKKPGSEFKIEQHDNVPLPEGKQLGVQYKPGAVIHQRLSRKLMFALPTGAFVASNCFSATTRRPLFAERLDVPATRGAAWKRAVDSGSSGRLCHVLWSDSEFQRVCNLWPGAGDNDDDGESWKRR